MLKKIYDSKAVSIPEVRKLLLDRAEEGDLSYMQRLALEHAQLVTRISSEDAIELIDVLMEKFNLSRNASITLANYLPDSIHEIRQLLGREATLIETETLEEILRVLVAVKMIDKKDKSFTDVIDQLDKDDDEVSLDEMEKVDAEDMKPDDI